MSLAVFKTLLLPKKQFHIEAKHTKDSKDIACSTLSFCLHSRALFLENLRSLRGSRFTEEKSKLADREIFRKKIFVFLCFGHAVTKNDFVHASARRPFKSRTILNKTKERLKSFQAWYTVITRPATEFRIFYASLKNLLILTEHIGQDPHFKIRPPRPPAPG